MREGDKAIAYVRVSVVGNRAVRGRLESPDLQRQAIDDWCRRHGVEIVDVIPDLNRSGSTLTRPGLEKALARLEQGDATGIVVAHSSRASRRVIDALGLIDELEQRGFWIAAADGTLDTTTPEARMATTMFIAADQREIDRFKERSAIIHRQAIMEKGRHMGPAPFGYGRGEDGRLVVDAGEAAAVRVVFEMRAAEAGWVTIARHLDEKGVRQRDGRRLNPNMLRRMVTRRVYVGEANHGAHVLAGAHPAVVTEGLWAAANRAVPAVRSEPRQGRVHDDSLLRGLLRCGGCRYVLKRLPSRVGEGPRWKCRTLTTERSATHECGAPVQLSGLDGRVVEAVAVAEFFRLAAGVAIERQEAAEDVGALSRRVQDAEALLDELSSLEVRRDLGAVRWARLAQEARAEVDEARRAEATARARAGRVGVADREALEAGWELMTLVERQEALRSIVQAVIVVAGDGLVRDRTHVVPVWEPVELPRPGARGFVACPFVPGHH